ncbi:FAD-dependent monooxygenase [Dactylosporangium sp. NPDC049140]|uniref:FAD-dependent monooxygenase n=1 Tax=Dactylosporangium sp. NPDC049140 TaxID=3155647 RepID=UPI00340FC989
MQTELTKDLTAIDRQAYYRVSDVALHDLTGDRPAVTLTDAGGVDRRVAADVIADVAPSTAELIYAWHPDGFALHSMRSATVSRFYLQVGPDEDPAAWSDERIWQALADRLGDGLDACRLGSGPITEKRVLPMRSYVQAPMRHGRPFLAGDAAHVVPPTGAKGLNLAVADMALLADALTALLRDGSPDLADAYSDTALRPGLALNPLLLVDDHRGRFACVLRGPDRATLFITAAEWQSVTAADMVTPGGGQVLAVEVDVPGAGWP